MSTPIYPALDIRRIRSFVVILIAMYVSTKLFRAIQRTYSARRRHQDIPQLPRHPIWGHLINMGQKLNPALRRHPDYAFEEIWESLGRPPAFLMDLLPMDRALLIVADPEIAEEIAQPNSAFKYSLPKS